MSQIPEALLRSCHLHKFPSGRLNHYGQVWYIEEICAGSAHGHIMLLMLGKCYMSIVTGVREAVEWV